jgi:hypothetical protein
MLPTDDQREPLPTMSPLSHSAVSGSSRGETTETTMDAAPRHPRGAPPRDIKLMRLGAALSLAGDLDQVATGVIEHGRRDRLHIERLLGEPDSQRAQPLVLRVDVIDRK